MTAFNRFLALALSVSALVTVTACGGQEKREEQGSQLAATSTMFPLDQRRVANITQVSANVLNGHTTRLASDNIYWRRTQFSELTRMARCVAVINAGQIGFGLGGAELGAGMASCRTQDGTWSAPSYISLATGTLGPIIGAEYREIVMLFLSPRAANHLANNVDFNLGAGVRAAAFNANIGVDITTAQHSDIITFAYTRGLIAEAAISGSILRHMSLRNEKVYGQPLAPSQILGASQYYTPYIARPFVEALNNMDRNAYAIPVQQFPVQQIPTQYPAQVPVVQAPAPVVEAPIVQMPMPAPVMADPAPPVYNVTVTETIYVNVPVPTPMPIFLQPVVVQPVVVVPTPVAQAPGQRY